MVKYYMNYAESQSFIVIPDKIQSQKKHNSGNTNKLEKKINKN